MVQGEFVKKKLIIIVPNLQLGGQERVAVNTADIMKEYYDVTIVTFNNEAPVYESACPIIDFGIQVYSGKVGKIKNVIKRAWMLRKLRKKEKVDFCISYGWSANLVNCLSGKKGQTITSIRGYANIGTGWIDRYIYKKSDKIIGCSQQICDYLLSIYPKLINKIFRLYNPYDVEKIIDLGNQPVTDYEFSDYTIVSHGRLEHVKGYDRLIAAFRFVKNEIPEAKLLIIGEGSERKALEKQVEDLGLGDSVSLIGMRKNPFAYLAKSSLYVLASRNEGFPNSLVEGMCFVPVLAVDCKSGPREILVDEYEGKTVQYGYLVEQLPEKCADDCDEIKEFAKQIIFAVKEKSSNQSNIGLHIVRAYMFSYDDYRIQLTSIFDS